MLFVVLDLKDPCTSTLLSMSLTCVISTSDRVRNYTSIPPPILTKQQLPVCLLNTWPSSDWGMYNFPYLDAWLLVSDDPESLYSQTYLVLSTCHTLGLIVNREKFHLEPSQTVTFIKDFLDTRGAESFLPLNRWSRVWSRCFGVRVFNPLRPSSASQGFWADYCCGSQCQVANEREAFLVSKLPSAISSGLCPLLVHSKGSTLFFRQVVLRPTSC